MEDSRACLDLGLDQTEGEDGLGGWLEDERSGWGQVGFEEWSEDGGRSRWDDGECSRRGRVEVPGVVRARGVMMIAGVDDQDGGNDERFLE